MSYQSIKERLDTNEHGFTLIEILVVILIIGILASIAIPVFLNQRQTANDAATKSDVQNVARVIETWIVNNPNATALDGAAIRANSTKSEGTSLSVRGTINDFCVWGTHVNGKQYQTGRSWADNNNVRPYYLYSSLRGGEEQGGSAVGGMSCTTDPNSVGFGWTN